MKMEALLKAKIFRKCTQVLAQYLIITLVTLNLKEKDVIDQTQVFPWFKLQGGSLTAKTVWSPSTLKSWKKTQTSSSSLWPLWVLPHPSGSKK